MKKFTFLLFVLTFIFIGNLFSCKHADTTPPDSVTDLVAVAEEGKIILSWVDPSDDDLLGIKIYNPTETEARSISLDDGVLVGSGLQKYEIAGLEDGKYYFFAVYTVDQLYNESAPIETEAVQFKEKIITVTIIEEAEPTAPATNSDASTQAPSVISKYVCSKCGKTYDDEKSATDCCEADVVEKEVIVYKYVCPKDKKKYDTAEAAAACCGVQTEYVDREVEKKIVKYVCPIDGKEYDSSEDAKVCCAPDTTTVSVIYNLNGGTQSTDNKNKYLISQDVVLGVPEKTGYAFAGWYDTSDFKGTKISSWKAGEKNSTVTLYAKWQLLSYSIEYKLGTGETCSGTLPTLYTYESTITLPTPKKTGYDFKGWYVEGDSKTFTSITAGTSGDLILTPKFQIKTFTVSFETYGGTKIASQTVNYGSKATRPATNPTKKDCTFVKWVTTSGGTTEFNFSKTTIKEDITIYAGYSFNIWIANITFNSTGREVSAEKFSNCNMPGKLYITTKGYNSQSYKYTFKRQKGDTIEDLYEVETTGGPFTIPISDSMEGWALKYSSKTSMDGVVYYKSNLE